MTNLAMHESLILWQKLPVTHAATNLNFKTTTLEPGKTMHLKGSASTHTSSLRNSVPPVGVPLTPKVCFDQPPNHQFAIPTPTKEFSVKRECRI